MKHKVREQRERRKSKSRSVHGGSVQQDSAHGSSVPRDRGQRNSVHDARSYEFKPVEKILVDANVLLYLLPPSSSRDVPVRFQEYDFVFRRLLKAQAVPVVEVLVLSEYFNRCLRLEYAAYCQHRRGKNYKSFKAFRLSRHGLRALAQTAEDGEEILKRCQLTNTDVEALDLRQILRAVATGTVDFNDSILIGNCQHHGWKLLTNDGDLSRGGIEVITTNPKLLRG